MVPEREHKLCEPAYRNMFYNLQLSGYYILHYDFDFQKQKIINMSRTMAKYDIEVIDDELDRFALEDKWKERGWDIEKLADTFPWRAKMSMTQLKVKSSKVVDIVASSSMAVRYYLTIATYTLRKNYRFSWNDIKKWWELLLEFVNLFSDHYKKGDGMKGYHVLKYFKQEVNLDIDMDGNKL